MAYSRLRQLAKDYAAGAIDYDAYRAQRTELLDGYENGSIPLERPASPDPSEVTDTADIFADLPDPGAVTQELPRERESGRKQDRRIAYAAIAFGVGLLILLYLNLSKTPATPPDATSSEVAELQGDPLRAMIRDFADTTDWSEQSVTDLQHRWLGTPQEERSKASGTLWLQNFKRLLEQQLNEERALAELSGSESTDLGQALSRLLESISLGTDVGNPTSSAAGEDDTRAWVLAQAGGKRTLQLFALNDDKNIKTLLAEHARYSLKVLDTGENESRYRVLYGLFSSPSEAVKAHARLPDELLLDGSLPNIKTFAELQSLLNHELIASLPPDNGEDTQMLQEGKEWLTQQSGEMYTLQLFAMNHRDNVLKLLASHPELQMKVLVSNNGGSRYLVLYGVFETQEKAEQTHGWLPLQISRESGSPTVLSITTLQEALRE